MLRTNLTHVLSEADHSELLKNNENVMICCGRMGPMSVSYTHLTLPTSDLV